MPGRIDTDWAAPHVRRLAMVSAGRRNAMDAAMRDALHDAVDGAVADPDVHAVILTGSGGDFSAGGGIAGLRDIVPETLPERLAISHATVRAMLQSPKPFIAAVAGAAAGGGAALMLACDQIVLGHSARIALTFMRIGLLPDVGTLHTLTRRIGHGAARRLLLDPGALDAVTALACGIGDAVVDDQALDGEAARRAVRLAGYAPNCWAETKRALLEMPADLEPLLAMEAEIQTRLLAHGEFREGTAAFMEKRAPDFRRLPS